MSEDKEPQPIWRQQSPIDLVLGTSLPTTFARDYLVIGYPNADLPGRFKLSEPRGSSRSGSGRPIVADSCVTGGRPNVMPQLPS